MILLVTGREGMSKAAKRRELRKKKKQHKLREHAGSGSGSGSSGTESMKDSETVPGI